MKNKLILKVITLCLTAAVSVPMMSLTVNAAASASDTHTHYYAVDEEVVDIVDIDNGYYPQVIHRFTRRTCGCGAISIDTDHAGETSLEEHTFDSYSNGYPRCSECGYVEYAPYLP